MDAEERTEKAITLTRTIMFNVFDDPGAILEMTINNVDPEEVEDKVCGILEYLEKTTQEAEMEKMKQGPCVHRVWYQHRKLHCKLKGLDQFKSDCEGCEHYVPRAE